MTRIGAAAGVVLVSLILCGLAAAWLLLPALSESRIKEAVARDTGRSISFAGRPRLSLWPEPAVELRDVELSNPPGMAEGRFAAADTVRLTVSGTSLWRGAPEVTEVAVLRPRINLLVDGDGRSNFAFERIGDDPPETGAQVPPIVIIDGSVKYLNERTAAAFAASNVDATLAQSGIAGPIEFDGAFNWNDQRLKVAFHARSAARLTGEGSPADFTISGPFASGAFSGRAAIRDGLELAGTLELKSDAPADLLVGAGIATASGSLPALSAGGAVDLSGGVLALSQAQLAFGRSKAKGDVALSFAGPRPHVKAELDIDRIDLGNMAGDTAEGLAGGWSEDAIDLEFLKVMDGKLSLAVAETVLGTLAAGPSRLEIGLENGSLDVALSETNLYGGSAKGRLRLDGSGPVAVLEARLEASGVDGGRLGASLSGPERIRGRADVDLELTATGASQQELVARLKGRAHLRLRDGALMALDVPAMLGHVTTGIAEGWTAAGTGETPFSRLEARFAVEDGIADTGDLAVHGPVAKVAGTGSIDLLRRRLDLKVRPQILSPDNEDSTKELPVAVVIEGSWSAPKIYPDVHGILENPAQAYQVLRKRIEANAAKLDLGPGTIQNRPRKATARP